MQDFRPIQVPVRLAQALHVRAVIHKQTMTQAITEILVEELAPELKSIEAVQRAKEKAATDNTSKHSKGVGHE